MNRPVSRRLIVDDLPSVDCHDEDYDSWNSDIEEESSSQLDLVDVRDTSSEEGFRNGPNDLDSDIEMPYESAPRKRPSWDCDQKYGIQRLPIKLPDGRVQNVDSNALPTLTEVKDDHTEDDSDDLDTEDRTTKPIVEDISTGARFGRPAVVDVIGNSSRKARIQNAKEEIARICQDIVTEPEVGVSIFMNQYAHMSHPIC